MKRVKFFSGVAIASAVLVGLGFLPHMIAHAAGEGNFSLQVTPSPLIATVKPGVASDIELKIRNTSTAAEELRIQPRAFKFDERTGSVTLDEKTAPEIAPWISFSAPTFTVGPGEWYTQKVHIDLPKESGFSYAFALQITRKDAPVTPTGGRQFNGSVAVFSLINVDRPGATKKMDLVSFKTTQGLYEYLPSTFDIRLKNTGNTIIQPYGNLYVQRDSSSDKPITTLPVNQSQAYLLPGYERTLKASWTDGFPVYRTGSDATGKQATTLSWNLDKLSHFRFGRYTAKVVAVYNDGTRDVPVVGEVTFWVIPWRAILVVIAVILALIWLSRRYVKTRTQKAVKKALSAREKM
jgi:hypothetical protein